MEETTTLRFFLYFLNFSIHIYQVKIESYQLGSCIANLVNKIILHSFIELLEYIIFISNMKLFELKILHDDNSRYMNEIKIQFVNEFHKNKERNPNQEARDIH